jgi:hypothetical protein
VLLGVGARAWVRRYRLERPAPRIPRACLRVLVVVRFRAFRGTRPTLGSGRDQWKRDINRTSAVHVTFLPITGEPAA